MGFFFSQHQLSMFIFLAIMGFLSGLVDSIAGGGGLVSLPSLIYVGLPIPVAMGTNKLQASIGTSVAVYRYYQGGLINFLTVYRGLIMGLIGAVCGAITVNHISNQFMQFIVPILFLAVFIFNLLNKSLGVTVGIARMRPTIFFALFGFILGFYDAFFGPGTGNFWIMCIVYFLGYTFLQASGYAKVLNLKSNLFSLVVFLYYGKVKFVLGLIMAVGQMLGNYLGSTLVMLNGAKMVRPIFMSIVFINIIVASYHLLTNSGVIG
jgi:cupin 2 domain-containing protein